MRLLQPLIGLLALTSLTGCNKLFPSANGGHTGTPANNDEILLCAGQSNMVGVGTKHYFADDPLVSPHANRQGPCYAAGVVLAHTGTPHQVYTVNCAVGGSKIHTWLPGTANYNQCLSMVNVLPKAKIKALLFWQGESDYLDTSNTWPQSFLTVVRGFQRDLSLPALPVVYAQIGAYCDNGNVCEPTSLTAWASFQQLQIQAQGAGIQMITTSDLPTVDGIHHNEDEYLEVGRRFTREIL